MPIRLAAQLESWWLLESQSARAHSGGRPDIPGGFPGGYPLRFRARSSGSRAVLYALPIFGASFVLTPDEFNPNE